MCLFLTIVAPESSQKFASRINFFLNTNTKKLFTLKNVLSINWNLFRWQESCQRTAINFSTTDNFYLLATKWRFSDDFPEIFLIRRKKWNQRIIRFHFKMGILQSLSGFKITESFTLEINNFLVSLSYFPDTKKIRCQFRSQLAPKFVHYTKK
jgi:hypothetical protein